MTRELILMRHGKSDWSEPVSDYQRPIKARGFREALRIGNWMNEQDLQPGLLISSPARRARETAETVAEAIGYDKKAIRWNESLYMADVSEILDAIALAPDDCRTLMVIGHNPGLEDLLFYLTDEVDVPEDGKVLPTAAIAVLETESDWSTLEHASCSVEVIVRGRYL